MLEADTSNPIKLYNKTIKEGNLLKITALLNRGADINSTDKRGRTALWWAAFNGNIELVTFLVKHKAEITLADRNKGSPLDIATELALGGYREPGEDNKHAQIVRILKKALYQREVKGITEGICNLGINRTTSRNTPTQESRQTTNDRWCMIL